MSRPRALTRRNFLRLAGIGSAGAALAACVPVPVPAGSITPEIPVHLEKGIETMATTNGGVAAFMLIRTVLAEAGADMVSDPRENVAAAITNLEDGPEYAFVVTGPIQVIVPIFAETKEEIQAVFDRIMEDETIAAEIIANETRLVHVAVFYQDGAAIEGVPQPQWINPGSDEIILTDRSIAYVFVKTTDNNAEQYAEYATRLDLLIADYDRKAGPVRLSFTDTNNERIGVRWAAVLEEPDQVLIHLRTFDNDHLGRALAGIRRAPYVSNDATVQTSSFSDGNKLDRVKNGPP